MSKRCRRLQIGPKCRLLRASTSEVGSRRGRGPNPQLGPNCRRPRPPKRQAATEEPRQTPRKSPTHNSRPQMATQLCSPPAPGVRTPHRRHRRRPSRDARGPPVLQGGGRGVVDDAPDVVLVVLVVVAPQCRRPLEVLGRMAVLPLLAAPLLLVERHRQPGVGGAGAASTRSPEPLNSGLSEHRRKW